jgi:hypothetical protein
MTSGARGFRLLTVLLSAAVIAVLAGCAPATHAAPTATRSASARPTPTVEPQSATPTPLLGGDCSKLIPIDDVVSATVVPTVALVPARPLNDLYQLPIRQAGGLECEWSGPGITADLDVSVLPNARAILDAQAARLDAGDDTKKNEAHVANVPVFGDRSWTDCISLGEDPSDGCWFDIQVGTFWIEVDQVYGGSFTPYPQASGVTTLLTHLVDKVRSLTPSRAWKPDIGALSLPTTCGATLSLATVRSVTGGPDLTQPAETGTFNALLDGAFTSTGSLFCQWLADSDGAPVAGFSLVMVPGSAWAWSAMAGPPAAVAPYPLAAQTGLGSAAFGGCRTDSLSSECDLFVLADHTWFELKQDDRVAHPATLSAVTSLARSYLTTIGFTS